MQEFNGSGLGFRVEGADELMTHLRWLSGGRGDVQLGACIGIRVVLRIRVPFKVILVGVLYYFGDLGSDSDLENYSCVSQHGHEAGEPASATNTLHVYLAFSSYDARQYVPCIYVFAVRCGLDVLLCCFPLR